MKEEFRVPIACCTELATSGLVASDTGGVVVEGVVLEDAKQRLALAPSGMTKMRFPPAVWICGWAA